MIDRWILLPSTLLAACVSLAAVGGASAEQLPAAVGVSGPPLRVCTGPAGGRDHQSALELAETLGEAVGTEVIAHESADRSLDAVAEGRCDAVIVQEDAYVARQLDPQGGAPALHRTATLYPEYVHLVCDAASTGDRLSALDPARVTLHVDLPGTASHITWRLFGLLDPAVARLPIVEMAPDAAIARLASGKGPGCVFIVSAFGGETLSIANEKHGAALRLVSVVSRTLHKPVGPARRQLYAPSTITARTWPGLLDGPMTTQTVDAVLFTTPGWRTAHPDTARRLDAALRADPAESR